MHLLYIYTYVYDGRTRLGKSLEFDYCCECVSVRGGGRGGEGTTTYISPVSFHTTAAEHHLGACSSRPHSPLGRSCLWLQNKRCVLRYMGRREGWSQQCTSALCILTDSNFN